MDRENEPMSETAILPLVDVVKKEWKKDNVITFLQRKDLNLDLDDEDIGIIRSKKVSGKDFLGLTAEKLENYGLQPGPASRIAELVKEIKEQSGTTDKKLIEEMALRLFLVEFANSKNSSSIYRFVVEHGKFGIWDFDMDIEPIAWIGQEVFNGNRNAPERGSNEIKITQPFCHKVLKEINDNVFLFEPGKEKLVVFVGDYGQRLADEIYADIIIGHEKHYSEFKKSPPNLSKGLGWEVKNDLTDGSKSNEGKGQLIKYARAYLTAEQPLTSDFYGCLTDGKSWQFVKIQIILVNDNNIKVRKVKFEKSVIYEWNEKTASLIAGLLKKYHDDLLTPNNNNIVYMNKPSFSPESLLASFIKEGTYIRLKSGELIRVQITSFLGNGRDCIVFLAQVPDYGIKDAVLKIEVRKNLEISQLYREISVLHALGDLSCVPTILFEGYTRGGSPSLLTDFAGQPLESWISNNGNIDDHTIFQIILDLLSCLEKIHARGYTHGDVAIRNVIQRNGHFYLIDFGLATLLQLFFDPCQVIIQDYINLCQIIGIIKFGRKMSLLELINKLEGKLKSFIATIENVIRWKITDEKKWLEKFRAKSNNFMRET